MAVSGSCLEMFLSAVFAIIFLSNDCYCLLVIQLLLMIISCNKIQKMKELVLLIFEAISRHNLIKNCYKNIDNFLIYKQKLAKNAINSVKAGTTREK